MCMYMHVCVCVRYSKVPKERPPREHEGSEEGKATEGPSVAAAPASCQGGDIKALTKSQRWK